LAHPLLRRAAAGDRLLREAPVVLRLPDGSLVEGTLDLAFRESGTWTVVDFKTDAELVEGRTRYEGQVRLYAQAVKTTTGEPAAGVILSV
jgi:ATP-dependent exoDNAse (exonuclease V) beta subunit